MVAFLQEQRRWVTKGRLEENWQALVVPGLCHHTRSY